MIRYEPKSIFPPSPHQDPHLCNYSLISFNMDILYSGFPVKARNLPEISSYPSHLIILLHSLPISLFWSFLSLHHSSYKSPCQGSSLIALTLPTLLSFWKYLYLPFSHWSWDQVYAFLIWFPTPVTCCNLSSDKKIPGSLLYFLIPSLRLLFPCHLVSIIFVPVYFPLLIHPLYSLNMN